MAPALMAPASATARPPSADGGRAFRAPAVAIPFGLAVILALASGHAWAVLQPRWRSLASGPPPASVPAPPGGGLSPAFTPEVERWTGQILTWSAAYHLPPDLVATVMQIESCGNPQAQSASHARGLFQVMPFHFSPGEDPTDPEINARRGLTYLARAFVVASGRADLALAGYNGGHRLIRQDPSQWPQETQRYVRWGSGILSDIQQGAVPSPSLHSWLAAGGQALCQNAAQSVAYAAMVAIPPTR